MKSFSILGGNPFSLALLVLLVLAMTPSGAAAPRKDIFLRKLQLGGTTSLGGYSEKPVDDAEVVDAADFAFATLQSNSTHGLSPGATSYEITSASTQVVAGLNIQMDITFLDSSGTCVGAATVVVYDQFGEKSLTSYEPIEGGCFTSLPIGGRPLAGGYSEKPVDDAEVVAAADFAFATLQSDSTYGLSPGATSYEITSASTQVVAGLNIQMDITFLDSSGACISTATVIVYDQFGTMSLTSYEPMLGGCAPSIGGPSIGLGGYSEKPVDSEDVLAAASFAFETLQSDSLQSDSKFGLPADATSYEVTSASTQVVAGVNFKLGIRFLDSSGACILTATVVVYDEFGTMSLTIYELTDECPGDDSSGYSAPKGFTLFSILMMSLMILSW